MNFGGFRIGFGQQPAHRQPIQYSGRLPVAMPTVANNPAYDTAWCFAEGGYDHPNVIRSRSPSQIVLVAAAFSNEFKSISFLPLT